MNSSVILWSFKGSVTVQDISIALPVFRKILPKEGVAFMNQKGLKTMEALLDTLQQWWAIARGKTSEDVVPKHKQTNFKRGQFGSTKCFSYGTLSVARNHLVLSPVPWYYPSSGERCDAFHVWQDRCPNRVVGYSSSPGVTPKKASSW